MDVQVSTQVMPPEYTIQLKMQSDSKVDQFKSAIAAIRLKSRTFYQKRVATIDELKAILNARAETIDLLTNEATSLYPELAGKNIIDYLSRINDTHPLGSLWGKFRSQIVNMDRQLAKKFVEYKTLLEDELNARNEEARAVAEYQSFAETSPTPVPTPDEMMNDLAAEDELPYADESSLIADISALDLVDTEAQGMITRELAESLSEKPVMSLEDQSDLASLLGGKKIEMKQILMIGAAILGFMYIFGDKK